MASLKFSESIQINADRETVFDYTQDYDKRLTWDTFLIEAKLIEGATSAGKGVKAWCVTKQGLGMETIYVSYNRPKVTAMSMTKGPRMFRSFAGSWNFKETSPGITEITFLYSFRMRFPYFLVGFFIKRFLRSNIAARLKDLKNCLEKR